MTCDNKLDGGAMEEKQVTPQEEGSSTALEQDGPHRHLVDARSAIRQRVGTGDSHPLAPASAPRVPSPLARRCESPTQMPTVEATPYSSAALYSGSQNNFEPVRASSSSTSLAGERNFAAACEGTTVGKSRFCFLLRVRLLMTEHFLDRLRTHQHQGRSKGPSGLQLP
jgi:hypothetical protein